MTWLSHVLAPLAVAIVFWWLAKKYPSPELSKEGPGLEELTKKYAKWDVLFLAITLALWLPVSFAVHEPLHAVARWVAESRRDGIDTFVFFVDGVALWVPGFFLALLISGLMLTPVARFLLKERYAEYERYGGLRHRVDHHTLTRGPS